MKRGTRGFEDGTELTNNLSSISEADEHEVARSNWRS
jgi:hypothetical protein